MGFWGPTSSEEEREEGEGDFDAYARHMPAGEKRLTGLVFFLDRIFSILLGRFNEILDRFCGILPGYSILDIFRDFFTFGKNLQNKIK